MRLFLPTALLLLLPVTAAAQIPFNARITALGMTSGESPTFFAGTATGFFRSTDERRTWTPVRLESYLGPPAGVTDIDFDVSAPNVYFAAGPTPGRAVFRSADGGASWVKKTAGLPVHSSLERLYVSRAVTGRVYALMRDGERRSVYRSDDRGDTWGLRVELPAAARLLAIVPLNANVWFYAAERAVFRSTDEGATWQLAGPFPLQAAGGPGAVQNHVTDLRVDPKSQLGLVMTTDGPVVGGDGFDNGVFVSANGGAAWMRRASGRFTALHLGEAFLAWRAETGAVWRSVDRGATFEGPFTVSGPGAAPGFLVDRRDATRVYAGAFGSADGGRTWLSPDPTVRPALGALKESLDLIGSTNSGSPTVNAVALEAIGSRAWPFDFTIETPRVRWLEVTPDPGPTPVSLVVKATPTGLPAGLEETTIVVQAPGTFNGRLEIPVRLEVTGDPAPPPAPMIDTYAGNGRFGSLGDGGPATDASLSGVSGLAADAEGGLLIAARLDNRIRRVTPEGLMEAFAAGLSAPEGLAAGPGGAVFVADRGTRVVRRIASDGAVSVVAGSGGEGLGTAQGLALQLPLDPYVVAAAPDGALFVSGDGVYRIDSNGTYLRWSTESAKALAVGPNGTVYAARGNRIEIQRRGNVAPFAGGFEAGYTGDNGPAAAARLSDPQGLAVDADGRIYIADTGNHAVRVVEAGVIRTYAGVGAAGFAGDGDLATFARLSRPQAVAVSPEGDVFVSDADNRRIRVVRAMPAMPPPELTREGVVSAASFRGGAVAPGQIVSLFGQGLATVTAQAVATPLPTSLAGVRIDLVDAEGASRRLGLFFVSAGQINAYVPLDAAAGPATLRVRRLDDYGHEALSALVGIEIAATAPGLFSADSSGSGTAAAAAVRVADDGMQTPVALLEGGAAVPIDLGPAGDQVVVLLFGTGIRGFGQAVSATVGGVAADVVGVAAQPEFVGLDQVNVLIPRALAGAGEVEIVVTVDGVETNRVTVAIL